MYLHFSSIGCIITEAFSPSYFRHAYFNILRYYADYYYFVTPRAAADADMLICFQIDAEVSSRLLLAFHAFRVFHAHTSFLMPPMRMHACHDIPYAALIHRAMFNMPSQSAPIPSPTPTSYMLAP